MKVLKWNKDGDKKDDDKKDVNVRLQLWDIAGQARFGTMTRVYYKEVSAAIIVFDVTHNATFDAVKKWKADIDAKVTLNNDKPIPVILLANKCDLLEKDNEALCEWDKLKEKINDLCITNGFIAWFETSAKDGLNIDLTANNLVNIIMENVDIEKVRDPSIVNLKEDKINNEECYC